jgi:ribonucleoside-diphosphate reductase alpha chain
MATVEKNPAYRFDGTLTSLTDEPTHDAELNRQLNSLKPAYRTAREISPQCHLRMVHAWQQHIDNGVSKTINLPENARVEQILDLYREAIRLDLKGLTVFRDRSLSEQAWSDTWPCSSCDGLVPPFRSKDPSGVVGEGPIASCQA